VGEPLDARLFWHLPISFAVSGFIATTHAFFIVEIKTQARLFPLFFQGVRADQTPGAKPLSLRGRGMLWAISACICPLVSLMLLSFAPKFAWSEWFELAVAVVGIGFSVFSVSLIDRLVTEPLDRLRVVVQGVATGQFDAAVPVHRADEIGVLAAEVNRMIAELRAAQNVRQTFGLHVGRRVAERLMERDPRLGGVEEVVTVMFVDIRNFTSRSKGRSAHDVVAGLNEFLAVMVHIVEERHGGMINKFLGDGFMALFGAIEDGAKAHEAVAASREMLAALGDLNARMIARGEAPLAIGIGLHTGEAVIGSIGSPERMEFTAIGSTVNLAARVEGMTKQLGIAFLFTDRTKRELNGTIAGQEVGEHILRGMTEPTRLHTA
jgi:adenylate cyclase